MSIEQGFSAQNELAVCEQPTRQRVRRRIAKQALAFEGFIPMEISKSQFADIRDSLESRIIDQPSAIDAVIDALERSDVRLPNDMRPIANLAFLGPTGVGKSETAKVLAELLSEDDYPNIIKIDCSSFSHGHEVASLIGSPQGFVGHEEKPILSDMNVEIPGTVILFDEIEKGSKELYNLMLQIMGDGELQLMNGEITYFRDTVIILTSNLGAEQMSAQMSKMRFGLGVTQQEVSKKDLEKTATSAFDKFFKPEFVNRLDKKVVFHPLSTDGLKRVLDTKITGLNKEYERQFGVRLSLSEGVRSHLAAIALEEPHLGARPVIRALEDKVQTIFGRFVGAKQVKNGTEVRVFHYSEAPADYIRSEDSELIFTSRVDPTIQKYIPPPPKPKMPVAKAPVVVMKHVDVFDLVRGERDRDEDGQEIDDSYRNEELPFDDWEHDNTDFDR